MKETIKFVSWYMALGGKHGITLQVFLQLLATKFKDYE